MLSTRLWCNSTIESRRPARGQTARKRKEVSMNLHFALRYARYALAMLVSVGFLGIN
jgi:hypothetical protein